MADVANRYATALFDLAEEQGTVDVVERDLGLLNGLIIGSADFRHFISSPIIGREQQLKCIEAFVAVLGVSALTGKYLGLVAIKGRLSALPAMISAFLDLAGKRRGQSRAHVLAAQALTPVQKAALAASLTSVIGGAVTIEEKVDPSLLGGLVVRVGSRMIDSSIRTRLQRLQIAMKEVG